MANDRHASNSNDEECGVQAFWVAVDAQEQRFDSIECMLREMQQAIARLGIGSNKNHYPNQNCVNEEVFDRPGGVHGPVPQQRHQVPEDSSNDEELEDFREVVTAVGEIRRTPTTFE